MRAVISDRGADPRHRQPSSCFASDRKSERLAAHLEQFSGVLRAGPRSQPPASLCGLLSGNVINLMDALKASLKEGGKGARQAPAKSEKKATKSKPAAKRKAG